MQHINTSNHVEAKYQDLLLAVKLEVDALNGNIQSISVEGLRKQFAFEAFRHTAEYDAAITAWLEDRIL